MENKIAELKKIKEALEVLINESEKPKLVSGWYVDKSQKGWIANFNFDTNKVYGIDTNGNWFKNYIDELDINDFKKGVNIPATPSEVQEALKKEYYKRGYERGKWIDLDRKDVTNTCSLINIKFIFKEESNELWVQGCGIVFHNGKWAEIIKTKTINELAFLFKEKYNRSPKNLLDFYKEFSLENKQTIIETLNNL